MVEHVAQAGIPYDRAAAAHHRKTDELIMMLAKPYEVDP
jgi:hypothetical protein